METFPPEEQQLAMAMWGMGLMVAPIMGPTVGGWITDNWNWRWNFYINVPIGGIAFLMVSAFVHDPPYMRNADAAARSIILGIDLILPSALGPMQIVLDRGQRADWFNSPWVVSGGDRFIRGDGIAGDPRVALRRSDRRIAHPRRSGTSRARSCCRDAELHSLRHGHPEPDLPAGVHGLYRVEGRAGAWRRAAGCAMFAMLLVGQIARHGIDTKRLIGVAFGLQRDRAVVDGSLESAGRQSGRLSGPAMVLGLGFGMIFPALSAATLSCVPRERMGYASSLYNMMRNTGAAIGIAYMTSTLVRHQQIHQALSRAALLGLRCVADEQSRGVSAGRADVSSADQMVTGQKQGLGMVYGMIQPQAAMLAFDDLYRILALMAIVMVPSFLLFRGASSSGNTSAH